MAFVVVATAEAATAAERKGVDKRRITAAAELQVDHTN